MKPWERYAKESPAPEPTKEGPWTKYAKAPKAPESPKEESWADKLGRFTGDMKERGNAIADSASDIGLPFTDKSLGEVVLGREASGRRQMFPQEAALQIAGQGVGAAMDTVGAAAEAIVPDSLGVGAAVEKGVAEAVQGLNSTPMGAKAIQAAVSTVEGWKAFEAKYPQLAKSIGSAANLAAVVTPSTGATKAVLGTAGKVVKPVTNKLGLSGRKDAITKNMLGDVKNSQGRGDSDVTIFGSTKYNPVDWEAKQVEALAKIPGIRPTGNHHKNAQLINRKLNETEDQIGKILSGSSDKVNVKATAAKMPLLEKSMDPNDYLKQFDVHDVLTGPDAQMFSNVIERARTLLANSDGTASGIHKARQAFDKKYNFSWNDKDKPAYLAWQKARNHMNDMVDTLAPDAKKLRAETQSPLLGAKEAVSKKAAEQADTALGRLGNYAKGSKMVPTSILSMGALASAVWAPWLAGAGLATVGTIKGVKWTNNKFRDELAKAISDSSKLIKTGKLTGKALEQAKADRLLLIDMMKIPQEGDKGAKE